MTFKAEAVPARAFGGVQAESAEWLFVHATGFCKEMWLPVIDAVESRKGRMQAMLLDQRGHGAHTPHRGPFRWHELATDVLAAVGPVSQPLVGVGHSSGGAAIARAEILSPGTFSKLILIEPIIFPGPYERRESPLAVSAERRRSTFENREIARRRFADGPFAGWDPRVLDLYIDHGFDVTGEELTLRCTPEVEAEFYREGSNVDTWDRVGEITCEVLVLAGERSDSHQPPYLDLLTDRFRDAELVVLPGLGHLAPMESPERLAEAIVG